MRRRPRHTDPAPSGRQPAPRPTSTGRPSRRSLWLATVAAALVAAPATLAASPATAAAATHGSGGSGRLSVRVAGLPAHAHPVVRVTGPHAFRRTLRRTRATLRVAPGRYRVRPLATTARVGGRRVRATGSKTFAARVRRGRRATVAPVYTTVVPTGSLTLRPRQITAVAPTAPGATPTSITLRAEDGLQVGGLVTSGPTKDLPQGLFAKATGVRRKGSSTTATLRPVTISEALPAADIDFASGAVRARMRVAGRGAESRASLSTGTDVALGSGPFSCGVGTSAGVSGSVHITPRPSGYIRLSLFRRPEADLNVAIDATATMGVEVGANASCSVDRDLASAVVGVLIVPVGPVVIPIPITVGGKVEGKITAERTVSTSATVTERLSGGLHVSNGRVTARHSESHGATFVPPTLSGTSASVEVVPQVFARLGFPNDTGLTLSAGVGRKLGFAAGGPWALDGVAKASVSAGIAGVLHASQDLFAVSWRIGTGTPQPPPPAPKPPPCTPSVTFDGSPGTGAPPATLGGYPLTRVADTGSSGDVVDQLAGPTGTIGFDRQMRVDQVGSDWKTWSHDYDGLVYATDDQSSDVQITLPPGTRAIGLYAEPNLFRTYQVEAVTDAGTTSTPIDIEGEAGARFLGFSGSCGATIKALHVTTDEEADGLAVGELQIAGGG